MHPRVLNDTKLVKVHTKCILFYINFFTNLESVDTIMYHLTPINRVNFIKIKNNISLKNTVNLSYLSC